MIERDEIDIGVTSIFATSQRKTVVDFSPTLEYAEYSTGRCWRQCSVYFIILGIGSSSNSLVEISMGSLVLCKVAIQQEIDNILNISYYIPGFSKDAWVAAMATLLVVPLFLTLVSKVLEHFHIRGYDSFSYLWNVFIYLNAFSQKVSTHKCDIFLAQFSNLYFPLMALSTSRHQAVLGWCSW